MLLLMFFISPFKIRLICDGATFKREASSFLGKVMYFGIGAEYVCQVYMMCLSDFPTKYPPNLLYVFSK